MGDFSANENVWPGRDPPRRRLHRLTGLGISPNRFPDGVLPEVPENKLAGPPREIVYSSLTVESKRLFIPAIVHETIQEPGDEKATYRNWTDKDGQNHRHPLPLYAINNVEAFQKDWVRFVTFRAQDWAEHHNSEHHLEALRLIKHLDTPKDCVNALMAAITYDHARHWKMSTAVIVGQDTLGIEPIPENAVGGMAGRIGLPRFITAQADNVGAAFLEMLGVDLFGHAACDNHPETDGLIDKLLQSSELIYIHTAYVILRSLDRGNQAAVHDRVRQGMQNNLGGPSVVHAVVDIQQGTANMLDILKCNLHANKIQFEGFVAYLPPKAANYHQNIISVEDVEPIHFEGGIIAYDPVPTTSKLFPRAGGVTLLG